MALLHDNQFACGTDLSGLEPDGTPASAKDSGIGGFFGGGIYKIVRETVNVGVQMRYTQLPVELLKRKGNGGGIHILGMIGFHF